MGDRSNIVVQTAKWEQDNDRKWVKQGVDRIWLYGHWMGSSAIDHAAKGAASGRTNDAPYLARVVFSSMVKTDIDSETGFGISTSITDNEYPVIVLDADEGKVWLENESGKVESAVVSMADFAKAASNTSSLEYRERYTALAQEMALLA